MARLCTSNCHSTIGRTYVLQNYFCFSGVIAANVAVGILICFAVGIRKHEFSDWRFFWCVVIAGFSFLLPFIFVICVLFVRLFLMAGHSPTFTAQEGANFATAVLGYWPMVALVPLGGLAFALSALFAKTQVLAPRASPMPIYPMSPRKRGQWTISADESRSGTSRSSRSDLQLVAVVLFVAIVVGFCFYLAYKLTWHFARRSYATPPSYGPASI